MSTAKPTSLIPALRHNHQGKERQVGIELEFAGCQPEQILSCIVQCYGGEVVKQSIFHYLVKDSAVGDFVLELDAQLLQQLVSSDSPLPLDNSATDIAQRLLKTAAEQFVPWEVVTPPIAVSELSQVNTLIACLRQQGAKGTRHAIQFAFGLHLNPDLPALSAATLLRYLQAYLCLYDWICQQENIDITRKLTPYVDHFSKDYILHVTAADYQPDRQQFIQDYLQFNPSRNRSLDLLPLIAYLEPDAVRELADNSLIKARPTFHYRLPNCDIDNPDWDLTLAWSLWLQVEQLANSDRLPGFMASFRQHYSKLTYGLDNAWLSCCQQLLPQLQQDSEA